MNIHLMMNRMIYGCDSKEDYVTMRSRLDDTNYKVWRAISIAGFLYYLGLLISTVFIKSAKVNNILYIICGLVALICAILFLTAAKNSRMLQRICMYVMAINMFVFAVYLGTVKNPQHIAVTTMVFLVAIPAVFVDKPYRLAVMEAIAVVCFCIVCSIVKEGEVRTLDIANAVVFGLIGQFVTYYMTNIRMKQMLHEVQLEKVSITDGLTGLNNRMAYETAIKELDATGLSDKFVYVAMDINRLKTANDTIGHEAGDELIRGASECIRRVFGPYGKIYRIGGDEFAAIITMEPEKVEVLLQTFNRRVNAWKGKMINSLSVSVGMASAAEMPGASIHEIIYASDQKMYLDKRNFYFNSGFDRRRAR